MSKPKGEKVALRGVSLDFDIQDGPQITYIELLGKPGKITSERRKYVLTPEQFKIAKEAIALLKSVNHYRDCLENSMVGENLGEAIAALLTRQGGA